MTKAEKDRVKKLEAICGKINKGDHGGENKDAVSFLGTQTVKSIERFPSGCSDLDNALGGGYPRGRFVEIFGPESGGKCLTSDIHVLGENGLLSIEEVFLLKDREVTCSTKSEDIAYPLVAEDGNLENTTHFHWNGMRKVYRIETSRGLFIKATFKHPIRVAEDGVVRWKYVGEVKKGDKVVVQKGMMIDPPDNGLDKDDGALLGLIVSEGHTPPSKRRISFSNEDENLLSEFRRIIEEKFSFSSFNEYEQGSTTDIRIDKANIVRSVLSKYGMKAILSGEKEVPFCVRTAPLSVQKAFLIAYFMGDGGIESPMERNHISMSSKSKKLLHQIQLMCLNLGTFGGLSKKPVNGEDYWVLRFDGAEALAWEKNIGRPELMSRKWLSLEVTNPSDRGIANSGWIAKSIIQDCTDSDRRLNLILGDICHGKCTFTNCKIDKLLKVSKDYQFGPFATAMIDYLRKWQDNGWDEDVVVDVCENDSVPTFDFTKDSHTFWSNGIVSHNTTHCLHAIAEFQKKFPGEEVAFLDSEYAFDEEYAKNIGVDTRWLIVHQPDNGEQCLEVLKQLVEFGGVKCAVVDSVAALSSVAEQGRSFSDVGVAEQARLMSKALRQLATLCGKNKCTVFWTNQTRLKIGIKFGNPETTPGGLALRFYASVRMKTYQTKSDNTVDLVTGEMDSVKTTADIVKNKTAPPYRKAQYYITFGTGIDEVRSVFDNAVELDIITKRGSWFAYGSDQLGQGADKVLTLLRGDKKLVDKIRKEAEEKSLAVAEELREEAGDKKVERAPVLGAKDVPSPKKKIKSSPKIPKGNRLEDDIIDVESKVTTAEDPNSKEITKVEDV